MVRVEAGPVPCLQGGDSVVVPRLAHATPRHATHSDYACASDSE